jgi:hypothetical protein
MEDIRFIASLPQTASVIKVDGNGGCKVTLEVPDSDIAQALLMTMLRGQVFEVTITPLEK